MAKILNKAGALEIFQTNVGREFVNKLFRELMETKKINHVIAVVGDHNQMGMLERINRTIQTRLHNCMTATRKNVWIEVLPDMGQNCNQ